jgi:hypothetical protein
MALTRAQVTLDRQGGLPEDVITNTFHFEDDSGFATNGGISVNGPGLISRLQAFYDYIGSRYLSGVLAGTGRVRLYDMADPLPRVPAMEEEITFQRAGSGGLPSEVALCLSYQASASSGQAQGRRRGRVFLGPFVGAAGVSPTGSSADHRPSTSTLDGILTAAHEMARGGSGSFRLVVYSPTTKAQGGTMDAATNDAVTISVDNAWDTIRSRGVKASQRRRAALGGTLQLQG